MNTIFPNFNPKNLLNTWWSLTPVIQDKIKSMVPEKDTWTLNTTKDSSGVWVFSLPQFLTFNESLCNGTEEVLDHWFEKLKGYTPVIGSKMKMVVTKVKPTEFTTKITWMYEDPLWMGSNFYYDTGSGMDVWLCPYVQVLFKDIPESMWITFIPEE